MKEICQITNYFSNIIPINRGKFGVIYKGHNVNNNNRIDAIKVLKFNNKSLIEIECSELIQHNSQKYLITIFDVFNFVFFFVLRNLC